jgi:hypothetical protein
MASGVQGDAIPLNGVSKGVVDPFGQGRGFTSHGSMRLRENATEKGLASGKEELNSEKES